jgi:hypothetical protein
MRQAPRPPGFALLIAIASWIASSMACAEEACPDSSQDIAPDRPSVSNSSVVVPIGSLEFENGVNWTVHRGQDALDGPNPRLRAG